MHNPIPFIAFALALAAIPSAIAETPVPPPRAPDYRLVWADEFDKPGPPDPAKWVSERGFERNHELQSYQPENSRCEDGNLVIEGRRERVANPRFVAHSHDWRKSREHAEYTSGSLITKDAWLFGRLEIRARFNALPGLWPAIWTTGVGHWPHAGEIDIMEFYQGDILANFVWAGEGGRDHWSTSKTPLKKFGTDTWNQRFHIWVCEWDSEKITISLDDRVLNTLEMKSVVNADGPPINPFLKPQRFRLNMAIGATGGDPSKTAFPQRYEVDYIRLYQKPGTPKP